MCCNPFFFCVVCGLVSIGPCISVPSVPAKMIRIQREGYFSLLPLHQGDFFGVEAVKTIEETIITHFALTPGLISPRLAYLNRFVSF